VNWRVRCETGAPAPAEVPAITAIEEPAAPDVDAVQRDEEESMLAEAGRTESSEPRRIRKKSRSNCCRTKLGARRIDNG